MSFLMEFPKSKARRIKSYPIFIDGQPVVKTSESLIERGPEAIIGRRILKVSTSLGSYGMGGPGFLGFLLDNSEDGRFESEWLVITAWGAGHFCLVDGEWVTAHPKYYGLKKPLYSNFAGGDGVWDNLSPRLIDGIINQVILGEKFCKFEIQKGEENHLFEVLDKDPRLPPPTRNDIPQASFLRKDERIGDFVIFQDPRGFIQI